MQDSGTGSVRLHLHCIQDVWVQFVLLLSESAYVSTCLSLSKCLWDSTSVVF